MYTSHWCIDVYSALLPLGCILSRRCRCLRGLENMLIVRRYCRFLCCYPHFLSTDLLTQFQHVQIVRIHIKNDTNADTLCGFVTRVFTHTHCRHFARKVASHIHGRVEAQCGPVDLILQPCIGSSMLLWNISISARTLHVVIIQNMMIWSLIVWRILAIHCLTLLFFFMQMRCGASWTTVFGMVWCGL
jgi:hypothetical protein